MIVRTKDHNLFVGILGARSRTVSLGLARGKRRFLVGEEFPSGAAYFSKAHHGELRGGRARFCFRCLPPSTAMEFAFLETRIGSPSRTLADRDEQLMEKNTRSVTLQGFSSAQHSELRIIILNSERLRLYTERMHLCSVRVRLCWCTPREPWRVTCVSYAMRAWKVQADFPGRVPRPPGALNPTPAVGAEEDEVAPHHASSERGAPEHSDHTEDEEDASDLRGASSGGASGRATGDRAVSTPHEKRPNRSITE